jgi:hypothetical protein
MTTRIPKCNIDACIEGIAALQQDIADIVEAAAERVRTKEQSIARTVESLTRELRAIRDRRRAEAIAGLFAKHRVNVGDLHSYFSDALQHCGQRVYPEPYKPICAQWALVENRT